MLKEKILKFAMKHSTLTPALVSFITSLIMWLLLKKFF